MGGRKADAALLDDYISGFHVYALDPPVHILHAGENLCRMLGVTKGELVNPAANMLLPAVHPADGRRYRSFLEGMAEREQSGAVECRIMAKDGRMRHVAVSVRSVLAADGSMKGYASMAEMTPDTERMANLQFMNDTVPCGLLRYTCEKQPRITFTNDTMIGIMRVPRKREGALDPVELYKSNIYLMIAKESRARFAQVLQEVYLRGEPHAGEVSVVRGDGSRGRLFGWITKCRGADGQEEFQSICMDVTRRHRAKKTEQEENYLNALSSAYDMIFAFDIPARTVSCLQGDIPFLGEYLRGVPMEYGAALHKWVDAAVPEADRQPLRQFLRRYVLEGQDPGEEAPGIDFSVQVGDVTRAYHGILLRTGQDGVWLCCSAGAGTEKEQADKQKPGERGPAQQEGPGPRVRIRTFGYFDVFVDGRPVMFRNGKAKELLALLVDRRGGFVSSEEAVSFLWEDEPASQVVLSRYRKVSLRLKNLLEEYGIAYILESVNGKRRLVAEYVECDLYQYLSDDKKYAGLFGGSYLTNYSWAEVTLGELLAREAYIQEKGAEQ